MPSGEAKYGGSDWSFIGDAPGPLSPFAWYRRLMHFYDGPRSQTDPFFKARDRTRPYTYTAALSDFQVMLKRDTVSPSDTHYALHGVRVEGWNRAADFDAALAEAHGGWKPGNAARYSRFALDRVFALPAHMMEAVAAPAVAPTLDLEAGDDGDGDLPPLDDLFDGEVPGFAAEAAAAAAAQGDERNPVAEAAEARAARAVAHTAAREARAVQRVLTSPPPALQHSRYQGTDRLLRPRHRD